MENKIVKDKEREKEIEKKNKQEKGVEKSGRKAVGNAAGDGSTDMHNDIKTVKGPNRKDVDKKKYTLRNALQTLDDDHVHDVSWDMSTPTCGEPEGKKMPENAAENLQHNSSENTVEVISEIAPASSNKIKPKGSLSFFQTKDDLKGDPSTQTEDEAAAENDLFSGQGPVKKNGMNHPLLKGRRGLFILPVLVLPVIFIILWIVATDGPSKKSGEIRAQGINTKVPRANLQDQAQDKMDLYQEAAAHKGYEAGKADKGVKTEDDFYGDIGLNGLKEPESPQKDPQKDLAAYTNSFLAGSLGGIPGGNKSASAEHEADLSREITGGTFDDDHTLQAESKIAQLQRMISQAAMGKRPGTISGSGGRYELYGRYSEELGNQGRTNRAKDDVLASKRGDVDEGYTHVAGIQSAALHEQDLRELRQLKELVIRAANGEDGHLKAQGLSTDSDTDRVGGKDNDNYEGDPETREINRMLDKVLAIQKGMDAQRSIPSGHSRDAGETLREQGVPFGHNNVYHLTRPGDDLNVPLLFQKDKDIVKDAVMYYNGQQDKTRSRGSRIKASEDEGQVSIAFYDLNDQAFPDSTLAEDQNTIISAATIPAVVASTQTVVSGATVKLCLQSQVSIGGWSLPEGSFIYGIATLSGERLKIVISHIIRDNQLLPVHLKVFDMDGVEGIRIPGSINREAAKQGAGRAISSMQLMSLDPTVAAQAASAGIQAAKGLLSKKVKLVRVMVKAGYKVLLVDEKPGR